MMATNGIIASQSTASTCRKAEYPYFNAQVLHYPYTK
jgi:hypothetical protein